MAEAKLLSNHEGYLELNGLNSLSDFAAEAFVVHEGGLELNGLSLVSEIALASLSKHNGFISMSELFIEKFNLFKAQFILQKKNF